MPPMGYEQLLRHLRQYEIYLKGMIFDQNCDIESQKQFKEIYID